MVVVGWEGGTFNEVDALAEDWKEVAASAVVMVLGEEGQRRRWK